MKKNKLKKFFLFTFATLFIITATMGAFLLGGAFLSSENIYFDKEKLSSGSTKIMLFDNNDNPMTTYSGNVKGIKIDELNDYTKNAFISIEDKNFYKHNGINLKRITKAALTNLKEGYIKEGASTISQQLIKNTHLENEKTFKRKLKEIMLTLRLEKTMNKNDILESYLNVIYFGNSSYGIENAALNYFAKPASELTLSESALLAGLIKSPGKYSPVKNKAAAINRRNLVLAEMKKDGYISDKQYTDAINEDIQLSEKINKNYYYENCVLNEASKILSLSEKSIGEYGFKIYTYLDKNLNENLHDIINDSSFYQKNSYNNEADGQAVVMDKNGHIVAIGVKGLNTISVKRPPASTIKPLMVYTPAIEHGLIGPASIINDEKININGYSPSNVGGTFSGDISIRYAVEKSLNIPSVKVLRMIGIEKAKKFAEKIGIKFSSEDNNYSLALGSMTDGVTLTDLTAGYTMLSSNGYYSQPTFIKRIEDINGRPVYYNNVVPEKVIKESTSYLMTDILKSSTKNGTSKRLNGLGFDVAGKTGTQGIKNTNLNTDVYSVGYTTEHVIGVWLGNPYGKSEYNLEGSNNGGTYATSMLKQILLNVYKDHNPDNFKMPDTVREVKLDKLLYEKGIIELASENTPDIYVTKEIFSLDNLPQETSSLFEKCIAPDLNCKVQKNTVHIKLFTEKINNYYIYRQIEDQTKLWLEFKGTGKEEEFVDKDIESDTIYSYYVVVKPIYNNSNPDNVAKSKKVSIIT